MLMTVLMMMAFALTSCTPFHPHIRKSDVERLKEEAANGSVKAREAIVVHGCDSVFTKELREQYLQELAEAGNYEAVNLLSYKAVPEGKGLQDFPEEQVVWWQKGAEAGNPNCMYTLSTYLNIEMASYYDTISAQKWLRQAADSLIAFARMDIREQERRNNIFDRSIFTFSQVWNRDMADESLLCRFSNAAFQSSYGLLADSFRQFFTRIWWQCILAWILMLAGLALAAFLAFLVLDDSKLYTVTLSSSYGLVNGFAWFYMGEQAMCNPGILYTYNSIGHFTHQEAAYGWASDMCIYATWIWVILFLFFFCKGIYDLWKSGNMSIFNVILYILTILFTNIFFYLIFSTIAALGAIIYGLAIVTVVALLLKSTGLLDLMNSTSKGIDQLFPQETAQQRKEREDHEFSKRIRENSNMWG